MGDEVRWWSVRTAQNLSASVYRCPFCDGRLPALSEHMLVSPEGDTTRRRHAHTECVMEARRSGALPTHGEWADRTGPERPSWWRRMLRLVKEGRRRR